jgi:type IV pilus secretin PilQ/predicted competence protein
MKTQFPIIRNQVLNLIKGSIFTLLLFNLALAVPKITAGAGEPKTSGETPASSAEIGSITDISVTPEDSEVTVTVSTDRQLAPNEFTLDNPPRLVLDFPNTINRVQFSKLPVEAGSVKQLRVQQFQSADPKIARVVLDLEKSFGTHEIALEKNSVRIVVHPAEPESSSAADISEPDLPADQGQGKSEQIFAAGLPEQVPTLQESPEPAAADNDLPSTESRTFAGDSDAQMPLIAALAPPVLSTVTPTMTPLPNSRFTGQPLTLDLIDIPLVDFFRLMAEEGGINIVMDPQVQGKVSIKVVKVPWDQILEATLTNNGLDKQVEGSLVRIARKTTLQEEAKQRESLKKANLLAADLETRIKRLNYAKAEALVDTLADQKTARGTIDVDERTNSLILTDIPNSLDKLVDLIATLDIAQPQVEIEARIVSATRDFARDIGIQFGFVAGNLQRVTVGGPNTFGTIGGTRPSATPKNTYSAGNPFTGRGASESSSTESAGVSTGANNDGNYNVNVPSQKPWGGVGISVGNIFDTFLLDAAITAGESKGSAKLISQPKVTAQNNSAASITQGLRFPVQIIANNTITVQFQNAALTLTVTPQITYEGNIILDLKVENNTPDFGRQVNGIPSIRTSESTTRVLVSDGGTTVIGGILIDDEGTQRDQVPGLGSLPVIGNLFKRNAVSRSTQEVLFFVTPRVVK